MRKRDRYRQTNKLRKEWGMKRERERDRHTERQIERKRETYVLIMNEIIFYTSMIL